MTARAILTALVLYLFAQQASAIEFKNTPDQRAAGAIETILLDYRSMFGIWPAGIEDLQSFARQTGRSLDLSSFSQVTLSQNSPNTIYVAYVLRDGQASEGGFAITLVDVAPSN